MPNKQTFSDVDTAEISSKTRSVELPPGAFFGTFPRNNCTELNYELSFTEIVIFLVPQTA